MPRIRITQEPKISEREADICKRLRSRRLELGIQQKDLAKRIAVPLDTLRGYEYARSPLRYGPAKRFCEELDVNQRWLASGDLPRKPYIPVSPVLEQFIPEDLYFSRVIDSLLEDLILDALEDIADQVDPRCEIAEIDNWPAVPWTPTIGISRRETRETYLRDVEDLVGNTFYILPEHRWYNFREALGDFLNAFARAHKGEIDSYLIQSSRDPHADLRNDESLARSLVASSLQLDPQALKRITMLTAQQSFGTAKPKVPTPEISPDHGKNTLTSSAGSSSSIPLYGNETTEMHQTDIAKRITTARKKAGLSQVAASQEWNISLGTLRDWEQGRTQPRGLYRDRIAEILSGLERPDRA